ncbi:MAG TPA: serine hydrolase [Bryobacteraceae bacterium]|nr:serine hydrolase [Bryobacteraceae bacterium]
MNPPARAMRTILSGLLCAVLLRPHEVTQVQLLLERKLGKQIEAIEASTAGILGVVAVDLTSGRVVLNRNGDAVFPQASAIKIPIMMKVFEQVKAGKLRLDQPVNVSPADAVGGSGRLAATLREHSMPLTIENLVTAMIESSDNTATNKLIGLVGAPEVNSMLARLGFLNTRLRRIMMDVQAAERGDENVSTPVEMVRIVELIYRGRAVDHASSVRMLDALKLVRGDFRAAVPAHVVVASKTGELTGVRTEAGVVFVPGRPFAFSVCATFLSGDENPIPPVARELYAHFDKLSRSNAFGNGGVR